jgi:hypothetical protein
MDLSFCWGGGGFLNIPIIVERPSKAFLRRGHLNPQMGSANEALQVHTDHAVPSHMQALRAVCDNQQRPNENEAYESLGTSNVETLANLVRRRRSLQVLLHQGSMLNCLREVPQGPWKPGSPGLAPEVQLRRARATASQERRSPQCGSFFSASPNLSLPRTPFLPLPHPFIQLRGS